MALRSKKNETEKKVYCGPSLPGISQFSIFSGMPHILKLHMKNCAAIGALLVPIENLNFVRLKLAVKGSYEQNQYIKIKKYLGGVK